MSLDSIKQLWPYRFLCRIWMSASAAQDRKLGVDFSSWSTQKELGFSEQQGNQYQPSTKGLKRVLKKLDIKPSDTILDIGCGKGKAMYLMSQFPFEYIHGYDISQELCDIAEQNFRHLELNKCKVFCADATRFQNYDNYNYFYMFNPFGDNVFKVMLENIKQSLQRRPRKVILIYLHPVCREFLLRDGTFRLFYQKKAPISWFEYECYTNGDKNNLL